MDMMTNTGTDSSTSLLPPTATTTMTKHLQHNHITITIIIRESEQQWTTIWHHTRGPHLEEAERECNEAQD